MTNPQDRPLGVNQAFVHREEAVRSIMNCNPPAHRGRKLWPSERWIALASVVIAASALFIAIYEARLSRRHQRLALQPDFRAVFYYTEDFAGFTFGNSGLGPGRLEWFSVAVNGELQDTWWEVL
jgi:hypothetical protein